MDIEAALHRFKRCLADTDVGFNANDNQGFGVQLSQTLGKPRRAKTVKHRLFEEREFGEKFGKRLMGRS
jgi:hypothetical protein